jgi:hypothetical protein
MHRTLRGLALALAMLLGALTFTGLLALSLQNRAEESQPEPGVYSPESEAIVDSLGWPIEEHGDGPANVSTERFRSRLSPG